MEAPGESSAPAAAGPKEVPSGVEPEAKLLQAFMEVASLAKVTARTAPRTGAASQQQQQDLWVTASYTQRNLPANSQRKYTVQGWLPAGSSQALTSPPMEAPDAVMTCLSPDGEQQLVVKAGADNISTVLQVWRGNRLASELHVPKSLHGSVIAGGTFGADAAWQPAGSAVAYVAEVPAADRTPAWGGPEAIKDTAAPKSWRGVGSALEDWGELNAGKRAPAVFLLDLANQEVLKVAAAGLPEDVSFGQPCWVPGGSGLLLVGYPHESPNFPDVHKRLGVVYCYNRPARLWYVPVSRGQDNGAALTLGPAVPLTKEVGSATSPVFTPDGTQLLYTCHDTAVNTGTHNATAQLCSLPSPQAAQGVVQPRVVVDVVHTTTGPDDFPGLYSTGSAAVDSPFIGPHTLLLNSQWRCSTAILAVDLPSGQVTPLTPLTQPASYSLAAVVGGRALAMRVGGTQPAHLVVADLPTEASGLTGPLDWQPVAGFGTEVPPVVAQHLSQLDVSVMQVTPTVGDTSLPVEALVFKPKNHTGPLATVVTPHGGPHTAMPHGWFPAYAYLTALGYAVVSPNYRGSTGYGQAALQSLPGNIGRHDVEDCMAALQAAIDAGISDAARVVVVGGSHGGFLSAHLLGQHPNAFKAGVLRNPVTNISLMVGLSDITDWCYVEVWGCEEGRRRCKAVPLPEDLQRMYSMSPAAHAANVKVPVLLLLGAKDKRVPPPDGLQYQAALRAAGVAVRTIMFPEDSHPLDKPQTEFEQWINVAAVLKTHAP